MLITDSSCICTWACTIVRCTRLLNSASWDVSVVRLLFAGEKYRVLLDEVERQWWDDQSSRAWTLEWCLVEETTWKPPPRSDSVFMVGFSWFQRGDFLVPTWKVAQIVMPETSQSPRTLTCYWWEILDCPHPKSRRSLHCGPFLQRRYSCPTTWERSQSSQETSYRIPKSLLWIRTSTSAHLSEQHTILQTTCYSDS